MAMFDKRGGGDAAVADRAAAQQEAARQQAEAAFWASPPGQARAARSDGARFFQVEIPHSQLRGRQSAWSAVGFVTNTTRTQGATDLLGAIEAEGWTLEHASWVYVQTGQNSRTKFMTSGEQTIVTGDVVGIYLFRAADQAVDAASRHSR